MKKYYYEIESLFGDKQISHNTEFSKEKLYEMYNTILLKLGEESREIVCDLFVELFDFEEVQYDWNRKLTARIDTDIDKIYVTGIQQESPRLQPWDELSFLFYLI